jgi:hypothetical protein
MWATKNDLIVRYGQEFVDKLLIRNYYDKELGSYVVNNSCEAKDLVLCAGLEDAKAWLLYKLSCFYNVSELINFENNGINFGMIKSYHIKLTILFLKHGGDCEDCDECKSQFESYCKSGQICSDDGANCLSRISTVSVTEYESCLPSKICCPENKCD